MKNRILFVLCCVLLFAPVFVLAENEEKDVLMAWEPEGHAILPPPDPGGFVFMSLELGMEDKVVSGAPYSADIETERTQMLADGNRIVQKDHAVVYRDGQGRTRREQELGMIGKWSASGEKPKLISIHDPVKNEHFTLEPEGKIAHKAVIENKIPGKGHDETFEFHVPPGGGGGLRFHREAPESKSESLGRQVIEGFAVDGTKTVSVIPAGEIGNESPIEIVSEKWYSPELQVHVMTRHMDPRFGETVYRMTNIRRGEPDPSLFTIPKDYKIEKAGSPRIVVRDKIEVKN